MLQFIQSNWVFISLAVAYCVLQVAYGRRSQIDAWCEARPKIAGLMKLLRAVLPDPWLLVQGLTLIVKGRLPLGYKTIADTILKVLAGLLVIGALFGCSQAKAPTAIDVATAAVSITDAALAAVIYATPQDAGAAVEQRFEDAVMTLERARYVIQTGQTLCPELPGLANVALLIGCEECSSVILAAKGQLKCQP